VGKLEKDIVEYLKQHSTIPKSLNMHSYCLTHTYDPKRTRRYVTAPYEPLVFEAICAYIQFESSEIEEAYSISQEDVIEILEKFYGCQKIKRTRAHQVDLYLNWEYFCASGAQEVDCLKREGMDVYFKKNIESFYQTKPEWRPAGV